MPPKKSHKTVISNLNATEERLREQKARDEAAKKLEEIQTLKTQEKLAKQELMLRQKRERITQNFLDQVDAFEARRHVAEVARIESATQMISGKTSQKSASSKVEVDHRESLTAESDITKPASPALDPNVVTTYIQKSRQDPFTHLKHLSKQLPPNDIVSKQTKEYLHQIREQKIEEDAAKKDRELRRRKLLLEHQLEQEEFEKKQLDEILLKKLQRHSKQERRIAEQ